MNTENPTITDRLTNLTPQLLRIACLHSTDPMQADDIFQHMVESILREAKGTDSKSRILTLATWRARNFIAGEQVYNGYVSDQSVLAGKLDNGEEEDPFETFQGFQECDHNTEQAVIDKETTGQLQDLIKSLPLENRRLICLLQAGNDPAAIARKLGVSRSAICQRMAYLRKWLHALALWRAYNLFPCENTFLVRIGEDGFIQDRAGNPYPFDTCPNLSERAYSQEDQEIWGKASKHLQALVH